MAPPPPPHPPNRPSGAPDAIMDDMELADASTTRLPAKPTSEPPPSVLLAYLENFIANPNNRSPQGEVIVDPSSLGAILVMMDAESTRLKELNRQMSQMAKMVETFDARLKALEGGHVSSPDPKTQPAKKSYATATDDSSLEERVKAITAMDILVGRGLCRDDWIGKHIPDARQQLDQLGKLNPEKILIVYNNSLESHPTTPPIRNLGLSKEAADLAENGKSWKDALSEVNYVASFVDFFAKETLRTDGIIVPSSTPAVRHLVIKQTISIIAALSLELPRGYDHL
ncbi:hypothetical protein PtA15_1A201 [Puccinia triticina]|uniref:Exocyst complex component Sec10 n=1 Tax=Puccinia triticina TaxID=208348 RepID=A0ABY7C927_9BASI|nr:uncharacterized protein PtA15_1A201 [Puccinia triticina]WAQ80863.1 hypothetical protein PtA15_1A201 [Puccinia triticina]WAR51756.1 hypothetical protein PtB15_1B192 [Puccinia triticina]